MDIGVVCYAYNKCKNSFIKEVTSHHSHLYINLENFISNLHNLPL